MDFNDKELERYCRQMILPGIGGSGQEKLRKSSVLIAGAGGLGSGVLLYLAASGVGTIGIVDFDKVELSNLHRQVIYSTEDLGKPKVISAKEKINKLNPEVKVITYEEKIDKFNIGKIIDNFDIVVDGLDNFSDKFLLNEFCVLLNKIFVHAGAVGYEGQLLTVIPGKSACLRCYFPQIPQDFNQSCKETGILGTCAGVLSVLLANEVIKLILRIGKLYTNKILKFNALSGMFYEYALGKNPDCILCSDLAASASVQLEPKGKV